MAECCNVCENFEKKHGVSGTYKEVCKNFKPKLPKVTIKEVALCYFSNAQDDGTSGCDDVKRKYNVSIFECGTKDCASLNCFEHMVCVINRARGYE